MKGKIKFIAVTPREKEGKKWYDCWISIEGYQVPYRINVWEQNGLVPVVNGEGLLIVDQDRYCAPVLRVRL